MMIMCRPCRFVPRIAGLLVLISLAAPFSVRADGLPGEYLLTNRWRTLIMPYSPLSNPALLTEANYVGARIAVSNTLAEFTMMEAGFTIPLGLYQSVGLTWLTEGTSPFPETQVSGANVQVTGKNISDNTNYFMGSYAINPWNRLSLGANVNIAQRGLFGTQQVSSIGIDLGLTYRILRNPVLGDHVIGISAINLLAPTFTSDGSMSLMPTDSGESYSRSMQVQLLSNFWERRFETSFDFNLKDWLSQAGQFKQVGDTSGSWVDAAKSLEWELNGRFGGWVLRMINIWALIGFSNTSGYEYWGFAGGFNIPSVNMGRDLAFAYQMLRIREGEAYTHSFYVRGDFGKHREEIYARKMAHLANITPNNLYNRALALYNEGNYWDAFFIFGRLKVEYPDFYKNDWVSVYMAGCQEMLDMRTVSTDGYDKMRSEYPKSVAVPFANLGLMRIYFRDASYSAVATQFAEMNRTDVPDSLRYHACYIMGQTFFAQGDNAKARQVLSLIPETHPEYVFAQHTIGIVNNIDGQLDAALLSLQNCVQATVSAPAQKEMINRSFVFLGYLFYENAKTIENALAKAVTALRSVPATSYYYEDAQLGLGWVGLRGGQMQDCIDAGGNLVRVSKKPSVQAEGGLLMAYAYMMQKNYPLAVTTLSDALKRIEGFSPVSQDSLGREQMSYADTRTRYNSVAGSANQLALTRQSSLVLGQIDSLAGPQKESFKKIDTHIKFVNEVQRSKLFERNMATVKEDLEYAMARAQKMAGTKGAVEVQQKSKVKTEEINTEIDKLKKEMENLDKTKK